MSNLQGDDIEFSITHVFNADRMQVFKAWTDPEHIKQWFSPAGFEMDIAKMEAKSGGIFHYRQKSPQGPVVWGKFEYKEVSEPNKLIYIQARADEAGNTIPAPYNKIWPQEVLHTLNFTEEDGKTRLTMQAVPHNAKEEEQSYFKDMRHLLQQGFESMFDQLANYLASNK